MLKVAWQLVFLVLCVPALLASATQDARWEHSRALREDVEGHAGRGMRAGSGQLCDTNTCCTLSATESCSIANMPRDQSTLVVPGGETRCIYSTSTPFAFQVIPGDSDKLLFYFQGGGACWDEVSTLGGFCTTDAVPQSLVGVFDRNSELNSLRSFTIVHVLYCSGDVHGGDVQRPYNDRAGQPIVQKGLANAQSVLNWVVAQQQAGALASTFSQLVVMGCSAGSIGTQLWANKVMQTLPWKQAAVVPDSYAGDFPDGTMGPLIYEYNFCSSGFLSPALYDKCVNQQLTLQDIDMEFIAATPSVPFAFIQSKTDAVQISFYDSVGVSMNATQKLVSPSEFYSDINEIFGEYNTQPNFITYLINGDHHCFTEQALFYDADSTGPNGSDDFSGLKLHEWINALPLEESEQAVTACTEGNGDNDYCSPNVVPKTFTEHY